ncbi:hypothetical protein BC940DRAFT_57190 [Gongronella butleri]|nr:hypothetical protein BC940DRAFT_57190 [Gongronella butleri]
MMNHQPSTSSSSASLAPPMAGNAYASSSSPSSSQQQQQQQQQLQEEAEYQHYMKRKRLTPPPTPLTATTPASPPALPPISSSRSSTSPITPRLPPPNAMVHRQTKTPVTGSPPLFRPEPLLPESLHRASSSSTHAPRESSPQANSHYDRDAFHYRPSSSASYSAHPYPPHNHPQHHQHHHPHHHQQHHPRSVSPPPQHQHQHVVQYAHHSHHASSQQQPHHLPHAYPSSSSQKHRSAFTPTHVHHHHDQPHMASPPYAPQTHQLHHTARHHVYNYGPDVSLAAAHHHTSQVAAHGAVHAIQDAQPIHLSKKRKKYPSMLTTDNHKADGNSTTTTSSSSSTVNAPPVRTYYEVDKDDHGNYILPVEIDSWTVVDLGTVVYDRPAYHNQRYIYPVNYTVRKWYRSMVDAKSDTQYTCRILDNGREPKFEVTADDCPVTYSGPTPTTVWTIIVRRAFAIRNQEYGHNPVGPDFFGLRKNTIAKMIQDLPHVEKCTQYVYQNFEPARFNKPGRNRRRLDTMISGSILGGVNYSLTSGRLNTHASHQQHQLQIQQRRRISSGGVTGTLTPGATNTSTNTSTSTASTSNNNAMNASATASHQGDIANASSSNNSSQPLHDDNVSVASSSSAVTTPPPHEKEPTPPHHLRHAHPHHNHHNHHVTPQKHENVASAAAAATYYAHPPAATTSPARTASPTPIETA